MDRTQSLPSIPAINDPNVIAAVSSLVRSADLYRSLLFKIVRDLLSGLDQAEQDNNPAVFTLTEYDDVLSLADRVINGWQNRLGIVSE